MRPQSEVRVAVAAALVDGCGTVRQLAQRTGWSVGRVRRALNNMQSADEVDVVDQVPQRGSKRRVPVYARALPADLQDDDGLQADSPDADLGRTLFAAWFQPMAMPMAGAAVHEGRAM